MMMATAMSAATEMVTLEETATNMALATATY
jgi:hypothetical protein